LKSAFVSTTDYTKRLSKLANASTVFVYPYSSLFVAFKQL
jgi:hypothetical protein